MSKLQPGSSPGLRSRVVGGACHDDGGEPQPGTAGRLTVALVGQPNVGESTVFTCSRA